MDIVTALAELVFCILVFGGLSYGGIKQLNELKMASDFDGRMWVQKTKLWFWILVSWIFGLYVWFCFLAETTDYLNCLGVMYKNIISLF